MPQSIYQGRTDQHPVEVIINTVPKGWAYIGGTIASYRPGQNPEWPKTPVFNRVGNVWVLLNADLDKVDYAIVDLTYNRFTIDITDHLNFDFLDYTLTVTPKPSGWASTTVTMPDDTDTYFVTGLSPETTYTVNVVANLRYEDGKTTNPSIQTVTTLKNPIPSAPINLRSTARTNSSIDLAWDDQVGSTAVSYRVYRSVGNNPLEPVTTTAWNNITLSGLSQDTKYRYAVSGMNSEGTEGPKSNIIRWATGHNSKRNTNRFVGEPIYPWEWGSWRPDIKWYDWNELWYRKRYVFHDKIYQGYWQKDPIWTGSTAGINRPEQESGRYRGVITYQVQQFRDRIRSKYPGGDVMSRMNVTSCTIRRVAREAGVGTVNGVHMEWYLTNTDIYDAAAGPPILFGHRNNYNSPDANSAHDSMRAGTYIDYLRLPRGYGHAIATGTGWYAPGSGTPVNGIMLYRGDHTNTGAGAAGYGRWLPHGKGSDWSLIIDASWDFEYVSYLAPYEW